MQVSTLSIGFIILNMVLGLCIPTVLAIFFKKKYKTKVSLWSFWTGCLVMLVFAFMLEQMVHVIVFVSDVGKKIQENFWLYAIYGGLMAGLFEETGRFIAMRFILHRKFPDPHNALMYGAGHGGFEALVILSIGMINNLVYAIMINSGAVATMMASLDAAGQQAFQAGIDTLIQTSPFLFLAAPLERFAAVTAQIALSVLVWFAAKEGGPLKWYPVAILLHFLIDALAVILSGLGAPVLAIEAVIWVLAIGYVCLARQVWKKSVQEVV